MSSPSPQESPRESRRRRIAHFKNNWGTDVKQIDEEDSSDEYLDSRRSHSPKSPLATRRSSVLAGSPFDPRSGSSSPVLGLSTERASRAIELPHSPVAPWLRTGRQSASPQPTTAADRRFLGCGCKREKNNIMLCDCGEGDDQRCEWWWDPTSATGVQLKNDNRDAYFHTEYSCGTAAVRGTKALDTDQHYWEVRMLSPVYGTDMVSRSLSMVAASPVAS